MTVVEMSTFVRSAAMAGMSDEERAKLVDFLARNPLLGNLIQGTGGVRKLRWAKPGIGKRGGYRSVYFYMNEDTPLYAFLVYGKNQQADLTVEQRRAVNELVRDQDDFADVPPAKGRNTMTELGEMLIEGLREAVEHAKGKRTGGRETVVQVEIPDRVDVATIRHGLGLSRRQFAARYGFSIRTIEKWENGERSPEGPARAYLVVISREPAAVRRALEVA